MTDPIVIVKNGSLQGAVLQDVDGKDFFAFKGIPYAKPPVGSLRFKDPQPADPWDGVRPALEEGDNCYAKHPVLPKPVGSEDCLYLNVYTPSLPKKDQSPKPVMFYIHGGGFTSGTGSSEVYGPDFLVAEDVVLVTINYRLHILGFLNFEDPNLNIPGNAGLKDCVLALKWVQDNIAAFGGDPNNVTIFGESAGGAASHYLILSPAAKGLFHKAILQSGCSLMLWSKSEGCARHFARVLGIEPYNEIELYTKLMSMSVEEIYKVGEKIPDLFVAHKIRPFGPTIEKPSPSAFLTEEPEVILKSGKYNHVPILAGYNSAEGMLSILLQKNTPFEKLTPIRNFQTAIPYTFNITPKSNAAELIADKIKQFYFGDVKPTEEHKDAFYKLEGDNFFIRDLLRSLYLHASTSSQPIYLYRMSIDSALNIFKHFSQITDPGVCHGDDVGYLFKTAITPDIEPNSVEDIARRRFCRFWSNFAKYGNPNSPVKDELVKVMWPPMTIKELNYIDIGTELTVGKNPEEKLRLDFWNQFYKVYSKL